MVRLNKRRLERMMRHGSGELDTALRATATEINTTIVLSMGTSPPGNVYQRGNNVHVASMPGYPPNVDTGALRASMRVERRRQLYYAIVDGVEYGVLLELGHGNVEPRPFVRPAFANVEQILIRHIRRLGLWR